LLTIFKGISVDVIHYIYPEGTVFVSPIILKYVFRKKIVMTFHLSHEWFASFPKMERGFKSAVRKAFHRLALCSVKSCDHGISLTTETSPVYADAYNLKEVSVIPHGIVVDPDEGVAIDKSAQRAICIVGRNYRDWDFVNAVLAHQEAVKYEFFLVGVDFDKLMFPQNVTVHAFREHLSHTQYVDVLRKCLIMFLPLKFATANNAILEAYQHKLFVLTTRAGVNADYQEKSLYEASSPDQFFETVRWLHHGGDGMNINQVLDDVRHSATRRYGWPMVLKKFMVIYQGL